MKQVIIYLNNDYDKLNDYFINNKIKSLLLVCDNSINFLNIGKYFLNLEEKLGIKVTFFSNFVPNPLYESVVEGVELFIEKKCQMIVALGGGSAIDVAKCIKLFNGLDTNKNMLEQTPFNNEIKLLAIPTTAGTGSEATKYAVIYYEGKKQSITSESIIPETVAFDSSSLSTLPIYQKKSTMLDALCHAVESFWSINSTQESKIYSKKAIQIIIENINSYIDKNDPNSYVKMFEAANLAGKAINISQTTAGHAMCYKITSLYGVSHGHAAALCVSKLIPFVIENRDSCIDSRGNVYFKSILEEMALSFGCSNIYDMSCKFEGIINNLEMTIPTPKEDDYLELVKSVNLTRLKNFPIKLDEEEINKIYHEVFNSTKEIY